MTSITTSILLLLLTINSTSTADDNLQQGSDIPWDECGTVKPDQFCFIDLNTFINGQTTKTSLPPCLIARNCFLMILGRFNTSTRSVNYEVYARIQDRSKRFEVSFGIAPGAYEFEDPLNFIQFSTRAPVAYFTPTYSCTLWNTTCDFGDKVYTNYQVLNSYRSDYRVFSVISNEVLEKGDNYKVDLTTDAVKISQGYRHDAVRRSEMYDINGPLFGGQSPSSPATTEATTKQPTGNRTLIIVVCVLTPVLVILAVVLIIKFKSWSSPNSSGSLDFANADQTIGSNQMSSTLHSTSGQVSTTTSPNQFETTPF